MDDAELTRMAEAFAGASPSRSYEAAEERLLVADLDAVDRGTAVHPLDVPGQIELTPDFVTAVGALRMTWLAVLQVCRFVCPGAGLVVSDLAGHRGLSRGKPLSHYSAADAAAAYNTIVRRRFESALLGANAVVYSPDRRIEAVVGKGYRRLANSEFLDMVGGLTGGAGCRFDEAAVVGRRVTAWHVGDGTAGGEDDRFWPAAPGVLVANSEVGDWSVRATPAIRLGGTGWVVRPYGPEARVRHAGKDFPVRLQTALAMAAAPPGADWVAGLRDRLAALDEAKLGFTGDSHGDNGEVFRSHVSRLTSTGLPRSFARRVVRRALFSGGRDAAEAGAFRDASRASWPGRTRADLIAALVREARDHPLLGTVRERAEQLAYRLLFAAKDVFHGDDEATATGVGRGRGRGRG